MRIYLSLLLCLASFVINGQNKLSYDTYHNSILKAEEQIVRENYNAALSVFQEVFQDFNFVFLKDIKIATQLAFQVGNNSLAFSLLEKGIQSGWTLKEIKKTKSLAPLKKKPRWLKLVKSYPSLRQDHENGIDQELQEAVQEMYKNDQKLAWGYLFRIGQKAKEKYANKKIKPHTISQIQKLHFIMDDKGYPGEKLIGEPVWMSTILSHHNSVSDDFVKNDTFYENLRPRLLKAIENGELNPYVFALIEDWRIAVKFDCQKAGFGYIENLKPNQISASDKLRAAIGIRSVRLRNKLVEIQEKTGMDFYLAGAGWVDGKIGQ